MRRLIKMYIGMKPIYSINGRYKDLSIDGVLKTHNITMNHYLPFGLAETSFIRYAYNVTYNRSKTKKEMGYFDWMDIDGYILSHVDE